MAVSVATRPASTLAAGPDREDGAVRRLGAVLLPLVLAEGALGVASAGQELSTVSGLLIAHVGFGVGLVALGGWALAGAGRRAAGPAKVATILAGAALVATGATGAAFLVTGFGQALVVDRLLALLTLFGTGLMIVYGGRRAAPTTPARDQDS